MNLSLSPLPRTVVVLVVIGFSGVDLFIRLCPSTRCVNHFRLYSLSSWELRIYQNIVEQNKAITWTLQESLLWTHPTRLQSVAGGQKPIAYLLSKGVLCDRGITYYIHGFLEETDLFEQRERRTVICNSNRWSTVSKVACVAHTFPLKVSLFSPDTVGALSEFNGNGGEFVPKYEAPFYFGMFLKNVSVHCAGCLACGALHFHFTA